MAVSLSISIIQNGQNINNNTSNVTVNATATWNGGSWNSLGQCTGSLTIDGTTYSFSGMSFNKSHTNSGSEVVMTKTLDIVHLSDGTKTLECSGSFVTGVSSGTISASNSRKLADIARKSSLSAADGTLGMSKTLTISSYSDSYTHTITYACGSTSGTICTKTSETTITWIPPLSLAVEAPDSIYVYVDLTLATYSGDIFVGDATTQVKYRIPYTLKPKCTVTVNEITNYSDKYGGLVENKSELQIDITSDTSESGSGIQYTAIKVNDDTYYSSSRTITAPSGDGVVNIEGWVRDYRGNSGSSEVVSKTLLKYSDPAITSFSVGRCNSDGTENEQGECIYAAFSLEVSSLNNINSATYRLSYKKTADTDYTVESEGSFADTYSFSNKYVFPSDSGTTYDVLLEVGDDFYSGDKTIKKTAKVGTASVIMHFHKSGHGIAFGKVSEKEYAAEFDWPVYGTFEAKFNPQPIPDTDLNNVTTPGIYYMTYSQSLKNLPYGGVMDYDYCLEVFTTGSDILQRISCSAYVFSRYLYKSTWSEWALHPTPGISYIYGERRSGISYLTLDSELVYSPILRSPSKGFLPYGGADTNESDLGSVDEPFNNVYANLFTGIFKSPKIYASLTTDDETGLEEALSAKYAEMPDDSVTFVSWNCHPAVSGAVVSGILSRTNASWGYFIGLQYGQFELYYKQFCNGVWNDTITKLLV